MYKVNVPTFNLDKLENVKSAVEHVGLYVGLVIFTAAGAKVNYYQNISILKPSQNKKGQKNF